MKINLISDLHLNFGGLTLPGGDVLIMAGDVFEARCFKTENPALNTYRGFIDNELSKYSKVIYILGNHEHYGNKFLNTFNDIKKNMPDNVVMMENDTLVIEDITFWGATLWTDMNKGNPLSMQYAKEQMNDFIVIKHFNTVPYTHGKLTPWDVMEVFKNSIKSLKNALVSSKKMVVVTHHAPSYASVDDEYIGDPLNAAYASELSDLILDNPQIKVWCHGHMHHFTDYMIGSTRIIANPRGYHGHERCSRLFDPSFNFEV